MILACGYGFGKPNKAGFSLVVSGIAAEAHGETVNNYFSVGNYQATVVDQPVIP